MNRSNALRLESIHTFPGKQFLECLYSVRGDGTGSPVNVFRVFV